MVPKSNRRLRPWHGCLLVVLIVVLASALMIRGCVKTVSRWGVEYTETTPLTFPPPQGSDDEIENALTKAAKLIESLRAGVPPSPVEFTPEELNLLVYYHPSAEKIADRVRFSILNDFLLVRTSIPMDKLANAGMKNMAGRYLNSEITLDASVVGGQLILYVHNIKVKGDPLPEKFTQQMSEENLGKEGSRPEVTRILTLIRNAHIAQGKVHIAPVTPL